MEAASNIGIKNSQSDYIIIHDDDDSWDPRFLEETVDFLQENDRIFEGVVTQCFYVSETIAGDQVVECRSYPYNDWVDSIHLAEMTVGNIFAPIAFLFSRKVYDQIGGYDETLPVLGDWDFNLRFLLEADIGFLPKRLARYHHRDQAVKAGNYSNSLTGGVNLHASYNALVRNKFVRLADKSEKHRVLSNALLQGYFQSDTRARMKSL